MSTYERLKQMTPEQFERWRRARLGAFTWAERQELEAIERERYYAQYVGKILDIAK